MMPHASKASAMAIAGSALMMAHYVAARSVRDALFLSNFPVSSLPSMVAAAAGVSLLTVATASLVMSRWTPARVAPAGFGCSALIYLGLYFVLPIYPAAASVALYILVASTGSLLTSTFWLLVSERFDIYSLKQQIGRIASSGTLGVIVGGVLSERIGAESRLASLLPALFFLHILVGLVAWRLGASPGKPPGRNSQAPVEGHAGTLSVLRSLSRAPYFQSLAMLVLICTAAAALLDYVFKAEAVVRFGSGESLLRFFAVFHAAVGVLTFVVQTYLSRYALSRFGAGRTLGFLPISFAVAGVLAMAAPGLGTLVIARGTEATLRGSLFRAGYELFSSPLAISEKRTARPIIDVGFDRIGDAVGAGGVRLILSVAPHLAGQIMLTSVVLFGLAAAWIAIRLHEMYVGVLESDLQRRAKDLELGEYGGNILTSVTLLRAPEEIVRPQHARSELVTETGRPASRNELATAFEDLIAGDHSRMLRVLRSGPALHPSLIPEVIAALRDNSVARDASRALRAVAHDHVGQLADALLDSNTDPRIRRRVTRILARCPTHRSAAALLEGLGDPDTAVRHHCAEALDAAVSANGDLIIDRAAIIRAIHREAGLAGGTTPNQRTLDYVFTLLALVWPRQPLRIAQRALREDDPHLRGAAMEYLESVLSSDVRTILWRLLGEAELASQTLDAGETYRKLMESAVKLDLTGTEGGADSGSDGTPSD